MQFQVPQFIESEDKIVGPLSLRQFAYIGVGGVLSAMLYFLSAPWLWVAGSFIIFAIAIGLAFVKIEGRPLANVLVSAFHFYWRPQTYVWKPEEHHVATAKISQPKSGENVSTFEQLLAKSAEKIRATGPAISQATRSLTSARPQTAHIQAQPHIETQPKAEPQPITRETVKAGSTLHKSWEGLQTGAAFEKKTSDKQFLEKKMVERYQIFQRISGDRNAAKRVDYR